MGVCTNCGAKIGIWNRSWDKSLCTKCWRDKRFPKQQNKGMQRIEDEYGKLIRSGHANYHGGHKKYPVGGFFSEYERGNLYLTERFIKFENAPMRSKNKLSIVIPLDKVQIQGWDIKEKERFKTVWGGAIPGPFGTAFGGGMIDSTGKKHEIVIPFIDENGIPQEPRFSMTFGVKDWAKAIYEAIVNTMQRN